MNTNDLNIMQIVAVAEKLKHLREQVVFVGGSTTVLLVDEAGAGKARQTEDVDFIIDIAIHGKIHDFEKVMRSLGFKNDTSSGAAICSWQIDFLGKTLKVDAMPIQPEAYGFSNRWYQEAVRTASKYSIKPDLVINVIHPVYFLGTKFEAFKDRGKGDFFSRDIEDIVYVLEHRTNIEKDVYMAKNDIKYYLANEFSTLLQNPEFENNLPGMLDDPEADKMVLSKMRFMSKKLI